MKPGDVIKVAFPQSDGKIKNRQAIILKISEPYNDCLVCAVSSRLHLEIKGTDIIINQNNPDFETWGLNYPGLIRTTFLVTISETKIEGTIGNISKETLIKLINNLTQYLKS